MKIYVGKVVKQDRHGVTLHVPFSDDYKYRIEEGTRFFTLVFVAASDPFSAAMSSVKAWDPFLMARRALVDGDAGADEAEGATLQ